MKSCLSVFFFCCLYLQCHIQEIIAKFNVKMLWLSQVWWWLSVIPAVWEAEEGGSQVWALPGKFNDTLYQNQKLKKIWRASWIGRPCIQSSVLQKIYKIKSKKALTGTCSALLNKSSGSGCPYLVPDFKEKLSACYCDVCHGFNTYDFVVLSLLSVLVVKGCRLLSTAFSALIKMITCFLLPSGDLVLPSIIFACQTILAFQE